MIKILFPCYTQPEMETIIPIMHALPIESSFVVIVDSKYKLLEKFKNLKEPRLTLIQVEDLGPDIRKFLKKENISIICTAHYASYLSWLFIIAGKKIGIPSIYISHGIIPYSNPLSNTSTIKSHQPFYLLKNLHFIFERLSGTAYVLKRILLDDTPSYLLRYVIKFIRSGCFSEIARIGCKQIWSGKYLFPFLDKVCIMGPNNRIFFEENGVPEYKIVITGQPRFDRIQMIKTSNSKFDVISALGLNPAKKIFILTTAPFVEEGLWQEDERSTFLESIVSAIRKTDAQLIIKVHPREGADPYKKIANMDPGNIVVVKNEIELYNLLNASYAMITVLSTTGLEALIFEKPLIIVNFFGDSDPINYVTKGVAIGVNRKEDLTSAIVDVLYNEEVCQKLAKARKNFVYEYSYIQDGKASERVANTIIKMAEESK